MKNLKLVLLTAGVALATSACAADNQPPQGGQGGQGRRPPSADALLSQMDSNQDGKLSRSEVKGPLQNDFSRVDTNGDGYISKAELESAPKPQGRPPQPQQN